MKDKGNRILVTGGAGFIGSHVVEALLERDDVAEVRVLDNLATGSKDNIKAFFNHPKFLFIEGDIRDFDTCLKASKDVDAINHQAALGSVPRSVKDPVTTNAVNVGGTLNIFEAARQNGVKKVVYASSSSVYGDNPDLPKKEDKIGKPISPYALTKSVGEQYAQVFNKVYNIDFIGLRYFNVFGPRQSPTGEYAAVVPLFMTAALGDKKVNIYGDGIQSRDFTYITNVIQANLLALFNDKKEAFNRVYNVACGKKYSLLELVKEIEKISGSTLTVTHHEARKSDIKDSLADISQISVQLNYNVKVDFSKGLKRTYEWFVNNK